eukprot:scaffold11884_cov23-Tisochrysis_lutea.AAC.2
MSCFLRTHSFSCALLLFGPPASLGPLALALACSLFGLTLLPLQLSNVLCALCVCVRTWAGGAYEFACVPTAAASAAEQCPLRCVSVCVCVRVRACVHAQVVHVDLHVCPLLLPVQLSSVLCALCGGCKFACVHPTAAAAAEQCPLRSLRVRAACAGGACAGGACVPGDFAAAAEQCPLHSLCVRACMRRWCL